MNTRHLQKGMSAGQLMLLLAAIGFGATVAVSVVPVYVDNGTVASALQSVQESYSGRDIQEISDIEIRKKLNNYFQVNMVPREIEQSVYIVRDKDEVKLAVDYEIRKHLMGNVDLVMVFENEVILGE